MDQQTYSVYRGGEYLLSKSKFGYQNKLSIMPIRPATRVIFRIYHGGERYPMEFKIKITPIVQIVSEPENNTPGNEFISASNNIALHYLLRDSKNPSPASAIGKRKLPKELQDASIEMNEYFEPPIPLPQRPTYDFPAFTLKLYLPDQEEHVHAWEYVDESLNVRTRTLKFPANESDPDIGKLDAKGWWSLVLTIDGVHPGYVYFESTSVIKKIAYRTKTLSYRWINHAFWNVLSLLAPKIVVEEGRFNVSVAKELGNIADFKSLDVLVDLPSGISSDFKFTNLSVQMIRGKDVKDFYRNIDRDKFDQVSRLFNDNDAVLHTMPVFYSPKVSFDFSIFEGSISVSEKPNIFISIPSNQNRNPQFFTDLKVSLSDAGWIINGLKSLYDLFGDAEGRIISEVISGINGFLEENKYAIQRYFKLALAKAIAKNAEVDKITATEDGLKIKWFKKVEHETLIAERFQNIDDVDEGNESVMPLISSNLSSLSTPGSGEVSADSLNLLDKHSTIMVVMMENRSFDHMLGDLKNVFPDKDYICFPGDYSNPPSGYLLDEIAPCRASEVFFPDSRVTGISPQHSHLHVLRQMSNGQFNLKSAADRANLGLMQGFTRNILYRYNEVGGSEFFPHEKPLFESPQLPLTYFSEDELPTYYDLARNYMVLDQWFAAHPGPTWPNRLVTVTGTTPILDNYHIDDPNLGFLPYHTIFDTLNRHRISWRYFEGNVSILRLFDKYRLDDTNILPMHRSEIDLMADTIDLNANDFIEFDAMLEQDELPRVVFVDPRFSDAPPRRLAYDDVPPICVGNGQVFIDDLVRKIERSKHKNKVCLIITYDEHGGFFDHVAPPGTPHSTHPDPVPQIYLNPKMPNEAGPNFMGVRVPAFLISPYVKRGSVSHITFDHTSIIKSILMHNRAALPANIISSFGERVRMANHIGMAMNKRIPAVQNRRVLKRKKGPNYGNRFRFDQVLKGDVSHDYHEALNTMFMLKL